MTPDDNAVTNWLIDLLGADPNGYGVGDHKAPDGELSYPYWVVWAIPGGGVSGPPLGASSADVDYVFQVDSVGRTRAQSQALAARARDRVVGRGADGAYSAAADDPAGAAIQDRISDGAPGAPVPEGTAPNEVWTTSERFVVRATAQTA